MSDRPDFTVAGNQATIDRFAEAMAALADDIGPEFYAGVRTAGWTDRPESFEGFTILVPPMVSGVSTDRVVDVIRARVARVESTSGFTAPDGRPGCHVRVSHAPLSPQGGALV